VENPWLYPHAFAVHPRLPAAVVRGTAGALIAMSTNEEGGNLLKNLNFNPIGSAKDEDWDDVRELGIALF
jgi:phosphonate transport system substrate-binding protein